jgi:hypothetical protein
MRNQIKNQFLLSLLTCFVATSVGCGGCWENLTQIDDEDGNDRDNLPIDDDVPGDGDGDGDGDEPEPEVIPDPVHTIGYAGDSPITLYYGESATLNFTLNDDEDRAVSSGIIALSQSGTGGQVVASQLTTAANGTASVQFNANSVTGQVIIEATSEYAATPVQVTVDVRQNPYGSLALTVNSNTRIPVSRADAIIYTGTAETVPTCETLFSSEVLPTATYAAAFSSVPGTQTYAQVATGSRVTILATGYNANDVLIANACSDTWIINGGLTTNATLNLIQFDTILDGDYDVLMHMSMGGLLPEPYETYLNTVTYAISDPAGYAIYQAMRALDGDCNGATSFTCWEDNGVYGPASFEDVSSNSGTFMMWDLATMYLDSTLYNQFGQTYVDITTIGGDIRNIVSDFEVGARFEMTAIPEEETAYAINEQWNDLVFEWGYGCPVDDLGCSRRPVQLQDTDYAPVDSTYNAAATHVPDGDKTERFFVRTDPHNMVLKYGAVILIALNEVVFPNLPGDMGVDSDMDGDTDLEDVMSNLIDCDAVAESLADATGLPEMLYTSVCAAGIDYAAAEALDFVLALEVGNGEPELSPKEEQGVVGGGTFYLVDADLDLATELVEDFYFEVFWYDPTNPDISQEILTPITGDGRLAASDCSADIACEAGEVCQPVASYLKVAELETDCRPAVGELLGEDPCTADNQCASGLCSEGFCFSACSNNGSCGSGVCDEEGASMNLDGVLDGLGDAVTASCTVSE